MRARLCDDAGSIDRYNQRIGYKSMSRFVILIEYSLTDADVENDGNVTRIQLKQMVQMSGGGPSCPPIDNYTNSHPFSWMARPKSDCHGRTLLDDLKFYCLNQ